LLSAVITKDKDTYEALLSGQTITFNKAKNVGIIQEFWDNKLPDDLITKCITYDKIKPVISVRAFNENYLKLLSKKSTKFKTDVQEFFKNSQCTDFSNAGQISSIMQQEKIIWIKLSMRM